jgi:hypothetical protein
MQSIKKAQSVYRVKLLKFLFVRCRRREGGFKKTVKKKGITYLALVSTLTFGARGMNLFLAISTIANLMEIAEE